MTINALSDYAENEALDHYLGTGAAWTMPAATWLQLHIGDPGETGTANIAALSTRQEITSWTAAAALATSNNAQVQFTATASETISWWSVHDASVAGNHLFYGELTTARAVVADDILTFAIGDIDLDFVGTNLCTTGGNQLLDHITGTTSMTSPTNVFVQFHTADPTVTGSVAVANLSTRSNAGAFAVAAAGTTDNDAAITATGTASETLSHISIWTLSVAGDALWFGPLTVAKAVVASDSIQFNAGDLDLTLL